MKITLIIFFIFLQYQELSALSGAFLLPLSSINRCLSPQKFPNNPYGKLVNRIALVLHAVASYTPPPLTGLKQFDC